MSFLLENWQVAHAKSLTSRHYRKIIRFENRKSVILHKSDSLISKTMRILLVFKNNFNLKILNNIGYASQISNTQLLSNC